MGFRTLLQGYQRQKASELLLQTNMSTEKIAWKLGFSEASAFSRAFQRWTGCAPGAFRREAEELS
ncbi:MAG TPA: hypothetical protein DCE42_30335 [Myxococcales bacterium]|nr:hypothetical protein [Deltaproteobacteria bacterium]MBU52385.1 hypothetical protein [Deltaproteobacteria bacterium]HAA59092.1 hypothetical protein [Myxococcales bacterium]